MKSALGFLNKIRAILTPRQMAVFYRIQILVILMAFLEMVSIASIAAFIAVLTDPIVLQSPNTLSAVAAHFHYYSIREVQYFSGFFVLILLVLSSLVGIYTTWKLSLFAATVGTELADRLYWFYLSKPWLYHIKNNSSELTKKIINESDRLTMQILLPFMMLISKFATGLFISFGLFWYSPWITTCGLLVLGASYILLFRNVRKKLNENGERISNSYSARHLSISEGFGGIKEIILTGRQQSFVQSFEKAGFSLADGIGSNNAIALIPRYAIELLAFGSVIVCALILFVQLDTDLGKSIPILSIYLLAGLKLLPAFQQIYGYLAQIKGAMPAYESLKIDLTQAISQEKQVNTSKVEKVRFNRSISLKSVSFTYPGKPTPSIKDMEFEISKNSLVGVVGHSGSGKSTLMDIVLGLLTPDEGSLQVDSTLIHQGNLASWQKKIGFVPQTVYLTAGSIMENVALGIPVEEIDIKQVHNVLRLAQLDDTVSGLDGGIYAEIGERGVMLSGGQRQRLGIARALYHKPELLVFDEATSALDGMTEKLIMNAVAFLRQSTTIIMIAHRLKTVRDCDLLLLLERGRLSASGTFDELYCSSSSFRNLADNS